MRVTISCRYCIAFDVMLLFLVFNLFSALRMDVASWRGGTANLCTMLQNYKQ